MLEQRGLQFIDRALAQACLERIGYYRLSAYWYPFRKNHLSTHPVTGAPLVDSRGRPVNIVEDLFRAGSSFQDVMDLYVFDKRLRLIFMDAIERIEVALRVDVALLLGKRSPYAHRDPQQFNRDFTKVAPGGGLSKHQVWLQRLDNTFRRSNEEFVTHFKLKYYRQDLPIWMAIELWDFGMLSVLIDGMRVSDQLRLAQKYSIPRTALLISFVRNINNIRNICAHHSRLWNRSPADRIAPIRPGEIKTLEHIAQPSYSRIYATAAVMQHFLRIINPSTEWPCRLVAHMKTLPKAAGISPTQAGFLDGWENEALWKTRSAEKHEALSILAYFIWEGGGRRSDTADADWANAESQLAAEIALTIPAPLNS